MIHAGPQRLEGTVEHRPLSWRERWRIGHAKPRAIPTGTISVHCRDDGYEGHRQRGIRRMAHVIAERPDLLDPCRLDAGGIGRDASSRGVEGFAGGDVVEWQRPALLRAWVFSADA
jgi:hypothetical protein